ncbi:MAG TPA: glycoside hydrolase family 43 protein [Chitinophagaceae bacterium]|nr:glycoside hydrolase family 43 protein [Chitinophagaceae bacterium]
MKKILIQLLFVLIILYAKEVNAQGSNDSVYIFSYFKNNGQDGLHLAYSYDGLDWKPLFGDTSILMPVLSKDKLMRDPCVIRGGDGKFHMVWTVSWNDKGIGYASSPDLLHWSKQKYLPVMEKEPTTRNAWAPEITYDADKKKYVIYWASTIPDRFALKDTAAEREYNHRMYYTTTKNFKKFDKVKLLYDPGFSIIDASIQNDGNQYVMFLKNETKAPVEKNIRVAYSKKLIGPYSEPSKPITGKYWAEGPTAINKGGAWIVYFDKYTLHQYGAVTSNDLINWTDISSKVHFPAGARHGTVVVISGKEFQTLTTVKK